MHSTWIVIGPLAALFAAGGLVKLSKSKEQLAGIGMAWTEDFSATQVKAIGAAEVMAALGMALPTATGVAPSLTSLAAAGLVVTMVGAAITHLRRDEARAVPVNAVLGGLAAFVAVTSSPLG